MENNKYMLKRYNISVDDVREELNSRNILSQAYEEILAEVKNSYSYKKLKEIALNQFINIEAQSDSKDVNGANAKKHDTAKIGLLATSLDDVLQRRIKYRLKNIPYSLVEDIVASIASRKHPESSNKRDETQETPSESNRNSSLSNDSPSEMMKDKHFLQSLHRLLAGSTASLACIEQHVEEIVISDDCNADVTEKQFEQTEPNSFNSGEDCFIPKIKKEDSFSIPETNGYSETIENLENIFDSEDSDKDSDLLFETGSNCSVVSIHTSDLSSYDDTITISSEDEEILGKKHMSVKEATEICYGTPDASDNKNMGHCSNFEKLTVIKKEIESAENISSSPESPRKKLPQRKRKQNPKYSSEDILSYSQISINFFKKRKN